MLDGSEYVLIGLKFSYPGCWSWGSNDSVMRDLFWKLTLCEGQLQIPCMQIIKKMEEEYERVKKLWESEPSWVLSEPGPSDC